VLAKQAFKMFLDVAADATKWTADNKAFSLVFKGNPLHAFVELPPEYGELRYCNLLCGAIRGALHMVNLVVTCDLVGGFRSEFRLSFRFLFFFSCVCCVGHWLLL
jgi:hypothetical protein